MYVSGLWENITVDWQTKKICHSVTNNQVGQEIGYLRSVLLPDIDLGIFML